MCTLCNKFCDGCHEATPAHQKRLEAYYYARQKEHYELPEEPWLAWVRDSDSKLYLKCILCDKWVMDLEGPLAGAQYRGLHGSLGVENQKKHRKLLENFVTYGREWDWNDWEKIERERSKWKRSPSRRHYSRPRSRSRRHSPASSRRQRSPSRRRYSRPRSRSRHRYHSKPRITLMSRQAVLHQAQV